MSTKETTCAACEEHFTPPEEWDELVETHVCGECRKLDLPTDFDAAVDLLLTYMDGDHFYDAAGYGDWAAQNHIDGMMCLWGHVKTMLTARQRAKEGPAT